MDRFIACQGNKIDPSVVNLKSNMDRFIESCTKLHTSRNGHLKSNMDRFIDFLRILSIMVIENLKQVPRNGKRM